ncbi:MULTISPECIES: hypothetical protein [unclassified Moraxella]|uniref:hypothetical protein n=1 Tax=unclassified Moraxella TaxID=2685852 RepID=UPI003AF9F92E
MTYYTLIKPYLEILNQIRNNAELLTDFIYKMGEKEDYSYDVNASSRYGLFKALQYQQLQTDEPIIVTLFKAEIERHTNESYQGLFPALEIGAYLLATYQRPQYVELFLQAKDANFDTFCGFDSLYLISAGLTETFDYIKNLDSDTQERFYYFVGASVAKSKFTPAQLSEWRADEANYYQSEIQTDDKEKLILLAEDLERFDIIEQLKMY